MYHAELEAILRELHRDLYCSIGYCLAPEVWTAWVQALGSVAAICAAIAIAFWQVRSESRRRRNAAKEAENAVMRAFAGIAQLAYWRVQHAEGDLVEHRGDPVWRFDDFTVRASFKSLERFGLERLPEPWFSPAFDFMTVFGQTARQAREVAHLDGLQRDDGAYELDEAFRTLRRHVDAVERISNGIQRLRDETLLKQ